MTKKNKLILICSAIILLIICLLLFVIFNKSNKSVTYKVIFDSNGGTQIEEQIIKEGELVQKPVDPTREGYVFVEWRHNDILFDFSTKIEKDITLVAYWTKISDEVEMVTVKFDSDGGTTISNQIVEKGSNIAKPIVPVRGGYKFLGWYYNDEVFDFSKEVDTDITITAKWEKINTSSDTSNTKPNSGSNSSSNNSNTGSNNTKPTTPTTPTVKKYTITFNSNGGSNVASLTVTEGSKVSKPNNPSRDGYTFVGWTLNGSDYNFDSAVTGNITLTAKWTEIVKNNYTVTFDSNGGSNVASLTVTEGSKASKPNNPSRDGYTFVGWTLNGSDYNFDSAVTGNITLTAKWTEIVKNNYTVTFDSNGGSGVASQTVVEGNKAAKPSDPEREGYNFSGWLLNGSSYNFGSAVTGNITLTAKWNQKSYSVVANSVDQTAPFSRKLTIYEEGKVISVKEVQYSDGVKICSGENLNVNYYAIEGETSLKLVLTGGTVVTASLTIN